MDSRYQSFGGLGLCVSKGCIFSVLRRSAKQGGALRPAELPGEVLVGRLAQDVRTQKGNFNEVEARHRNQW